MKILDFGSLNLDYVYSTSHIVAPGETISSRSMNVFPGGKGLNQAVALARASTKADKNNCAVYMAGGVGSNGQMLLEVLNECGVNTKWVKKFSLPNGNAMIQVADSGENSIVLFGGTNQLVTEEYVNEVLADFSSGDVIVLQNEINLIDYIVDEAYKKGMKIVLNPSPFNEKLSSVDYSKVDLFFVNEVEAAQITGEHTEEAVLDKMEKMFPLSGIVMTLGKKGAVFSRDGQRFTNGIYNVKVVDTTAAGDTFTGFFTQAYYDGKHNAAQALELASKASSIAVSRAGAAPSIPLLKEVMEFKFK